MKRLLALVLSFGALALATCEVHSDGRFEIVGMKTEWVEPSMWEIGYPADRTDYYTPATCVPEIRSRELRFKA